MNWLENRAYKSSETFTEVYRNTRPAGFSAGKAYPARGVVKPAAATLRR